MYTVDSQLSSYPNLEPPMIYCSGVAKPGHTGACAPATRGRAPAVLVCLALIVPLLIANQVQKKASKIEYIAICVHRMSLSSTLS